MSPLTVNHFPHFGAASLPDVHLDGVLANPTTIPVDFLFHDINLNPVLPSPLPQIPLPEKWIYVLSGGGAKGCFEFGALTYIHRKYNQYKPIAICSTSVGSINAIPLAEGQANAIHKLRKAWLSLSEQSDMFVPAPWLKEVMNYHTFAALNVDELFFNSEANWARNLNFFETAFKLFSTPYPLDQIAADFKNAVNLMRKEGKSIYSLDPTLARIRENIDMSAISNSGLKLRLASVNLEIGELAYVTEKGDLIRVTDKGQVSLPLNSTSTEAIINGALASAAIPGVFPPMQLTTTDGIGYHYVDGGVREIFPFKPVIDLMNGELNGVVGEKSILAISASAQGVHNPHLFLDLDVWDYSQKSIDEILMRSLDIFTDEMVEDDIHPREGFGQFKRVLFIFPQFNVMSTIDVDPGLILINAAYGWMTAHDTIRRNQLTPEDYRYLVFTTNYITAARKRAWDLENQARKGFGGIVWQPGLLQLIRKFKRGIFEMTHSRIEKWGLESLPSMAELSYPALDNNNDHPDWWLKFERHATDKGPFSLMWKLHPHNKAFHHWGSPWEASVDQDGLQIPAELPPA